MKVMNQSSSQGSLLDQNTAREILYSQMHQTTSQHHHQPRQGSQMSVSSGGGGYNYSYYQ